MGHRSVPELERLLAAANAKRTKAVNRCRRIAQRLRWARIRAGVYVSAGAALEDVLGSQGEVSIGVLVEMLGCTKARANSIIYRAHRSGRLRRVRRGVYVRAQKGEASK